MLAARCAALPRRPHVASSASPLNRPRWRRMRRSSRARRPPCRSRPAVTPLLSCWSSTCSPTAAARSTGREPGPPRLPKSPYQPAWTTDVRLARDPHRRRQLPFLFRSCHLGPRLMSAGNLFGLVSRCSSSRTWSTHFSAGRSSVSGIGIGQIVVYARLLIALGYPLGLYMARVYTGTPLPRCRRARARLLRLLGGAPARAELEGLRRRRCSSSAASSRSPSTGSCGSRATSS